MKDRLKVFLFLFLILLVGHGCSDPPPAQYQQTTPTVNTPSPAVEEKPLAVRPADDVVVADNILAKNYVVILDGSGSMSDPACNDEGSTKIKTAKTALKEWLETVPAGSNVGFVSFGSSWTILDIAGNSIERLKKVVESVEVGGLTPLASAFMVAHKMLMKQFHSQLGYGEYTIVCLTDGENNDPRESLGHWIRSILQEPISIYTIGFCIGQKHELNQPGKMVYREAGNLKEIRQGLAEIVAEANTYTVLKFSQ